MSKKIKDTSLIPRPSFCLVLFECFPNATTEGLGYLIRPGKLDLFFHISARFVYMRPATSTVITDFHAMTHVLLMAIARWICRVYIVLANNE